MTLFGIDPLSVGATTDEWYTPPWVFKAAGVTFDLDVCAPLDPLCRTVPARQQFTVADDGLSRNWHGLIWCNPPYSRAEPWVERWARHPDGLLLVPTVPHVKWIGPLLAGADAVTLLEVNFGRPDGTQTQVRWACLLASRGPLAASALARVAAADKYAAGGYVGWSGQARGPVSSPSGDEPGPLPRATALSQASIPLEATP